MTNPTHEAPPFPPYSSAKRSGLVYLRDQVAEYFLSRAIPVEVAPVGLKYRSFTLNQNPVLGGGRIVFVPGRFEGDTTLKVRDYGTLSRRTMNSVSVENPREIGAWERLFTICVWAAQPPGTSGNSEAATQAADDLLECVFRAIQMAPDPTGGNMSASVVWGGVSVNSPPEDSSFGSELIVQASQIGPIFGETLEVVTGTLKNFTTDRVNFK